MTKRTVTLLSVLIGAGPFWFLCSFYFFWLASFLYLRQWPRQHIANPDSLPFGFYYEWLYLCLVFWPGPLLLVLGGLIWARVEGGKLMPGLLTLFASSILFFWLLSTDPGECFKWFCD